MRRAGEARHRGDRDNGVTKDPDDRLGERSNDALANAAPGGGAGRRICFVLESLEVGGAETHAVSLGESLRRSGWHVLFAVMREGGALAGRCREAGIEVRDGLMPTRRGFQVVRRLGAVAAQRPLNTLFVVECFYLSALLAYRKVKRATGARAYAIIHNWPSRREFSHSWLRPLRVGLMNRLFNRIIFIAEGQREHYEKRLGIRFASTEVIASGIDVERFAPASPEHDPARRERGVRCLRVGLIGSLQPRKGHEYFLQAATEILGRRKNVEFLIVGDGPRRAELRGLAHDLGIDGHVHFLGVRSDLPDLLRTLDVLVLASYEAGGGHAETLPLVLLEAGATALPVVATRVGAVEDIVVDERTGFLVPPRDWQALAERITRLLDDPDLRREMGTIARERIFAKFNARRMFSRFERCFRGAEGGL